MPHTKATLMRVRSGSGRVQMPLNALQYCRCVKAILWPLFLRVKDTVSQHVIDSVVSRIIQAHELLSTRHRSHVSIAGRRRWPRHPSIGDCQHGHTRGYCCSFAPIQVHCTVQRVRRDQWPNRQATSCGDGCPHLNDQASSEEEIDFALCTL
jgi:hypothetical protein